MTLVRLLALIVGKRRPVLAPTALSMLAVTGLFALALLIPNRGDVQSATAAELTTVALDPATPIHQLTLHDRLIVGLEARLPSEIAFVDRVVLAVRRGRLPESLVNQTFFWARQRASRPRNGRLRRGIIYFEPAMKARAEQIGLDL